jgi:hypothetical protein
VETIWPHLRELAQSHERLGDQLRQLRQRGERVADDVAREAAALEAAPTSEASGFQSTLRHARGERDRTLAGLDADRAQLANERAARGADKQGYQEQVAALQPLAEAREHKRWWTGAWWKAARRGDVVAAMTGLQEQVRQVDGLLDGLAGQETQLQAAQDEAQRRFAEERERLTAAEVAVRRAELEDQETALGRELNLIEGKWQGACRELEAQLIPPAEMNPAAVEAGQQAWLSRVAQDEEALTFARHWVRCLDESRESLPRRVLECSNLVAATTATLNSDELFRDGSFPGRPFDLLILEEADQVTESEFVAAARRARRCVLVGEPVGEGEDETPHATPEPPVRTKPVSSAARPSMLSPAALRPGFFHRLWRLLHCDPRRLPYAWVQEQGRLRCRLHPFSDEQARWIESERVADFPEVELRILAVPRVTPQLIEVVFPSTMTIAQAKEFIFRELQQLPVQAPSSVARWVEEPDRLVFRLADPPLTSTVSVHLEPGVCERVGRLPARGQQCAACAETSAEASSAPWYTCCVEFDPAAGWLRERAAHWVEQHLSLRDLGRTIRLEKIYRMTSAMATVVADILALGDPASHACRHLTELPEPTPPDSTARPGRPTIEFVPVPPLWHPRAEKTGRGERRGGRSAATVVAAPSLVLPKAGAGLELDLADVRHRDRLPGDLRPGLPDRGFVNYLEAQAVVRALEELVGNSSSRSSIGVICLYTAQAQLIRRLAARVPALAGSRVDIRIDTPAGFRQRECDIVLVSLTRSHGHRAVSFGESPRQLAQALTRARSRLIVFGDPGTLARRRQWEATVDHLDGGSSARERAVCGRLLDYLQKLGPRLHGLRFGEGCHA